MSRDCPFRSWAVTIELAALLLAFSIVGASAQTQSIAAPTQHTFFHVVLDRSLTTPVTGRLLLFVAQPSGDSENVDMNTMAPESVYVVAKEVPHLAPGETIDIDADDLIFPHPLSQAAAGSYRAQAVLDVHHSYNYDAALPAISSAVRSR